MPNTAMAPLQQAVSERPQHNEGLLRHSVLAVPAQSSWSAAAFTASRRPQASATSRLWEQLQKSHDIGPIASGRRSKVTLAPGAFELLA